MEVVPLYTVPSGRLARARSGGAAVVEEAAPPPLCSPCGEGSASSFVLPCGGAPLCSPCGGGSAQDNDLNDAEGGERTKDAGEAGLNAYLVTVHARMQACIQREMHAFSKQSFETCSMAT